MLDSIVIIVLSTLFSCIISMVGYWLTTANKFISREDVEKMINTMHGNLTEKNNLMNYQIAELKENDKEMTKLIANSNAAINSLNLEVAKLNHVLNSLLERLEKNNV